MFNEINKERHQSFSSVVSSLCCGRKKSTTVQRRSGHWVVKGGWAAVCLVSEVWRCKIQRKQATGAEKQAHFQIAITVKICTSLSNAVDVKMKPRQQSHHHCVKENVAFSVYLHRMQAVCSILAKMSGLMSTAPCGQLRCSRRITAAWCTCIVQLLEVALWYGIFYLCAHLIFLQKNLSDIRYIPSSQGLTVFSVLVGGGQR